MGLRMIDAEDAAQSPELVAVHAFDLSVPDLRTETGNAVKPLGVS
jgi:hypothetical protein